MAGSAITVTRSKHQIGQGPKLDVISVSWLSDDGDGSVDLPIAAGLSEVELCGSLLQVEAVGGTTTPTADYDVELQTPDGGNLIGTLLTDCPAAGGKVGIPAVPPTLDFEVNLVVSGAGNAKTGRVDLYIATQIG